MSIGPLSWSWAMFVQNMKLIHQLICSIIDIGHMGVFSLSSHLLVLFEQPVLIMYIHVLISCGSRQRWKFKLNNLAVKGLTTLCISKHVLNVNKIRWTNDVLLLGRRRRRWHNMETTLGRQCTCDSLLYDMYSILHSKGLATRALINTAPILKGWGLA